MGTWNRLGGYLWVAVGAGLIAGCGFFDLRPPVPPEQPVVIPNRPSNSADNVLYNLEQAIRYKQDGLLQYEESLSEVGFQLFLDAIDRGDLGLGAPEWLSRSADVEAHRRLVNDIPDSFYFAFGEAGFQDVSDTLVTYGNIPYELLYIGPQGDTVGVAGGVADLAVKEVRAARWAVLTWIDHRNQQEPPDTTLGFLHGERAAGP